jgi:hypothetical protein
MKQGHAHQDENTAPAARHWVLPHSDRNSVLFVVRKSRALRILPEREN